MESGITPPVTARLLVTIGEEVGHGATHGFDEGTAEIVAVDNGVVAPQQQSQEEAVNVGMMDSTGPHDFHLTRRLLALADEHDVPAVRDVYRVYRSDAAPAVESGVEARTALLGFGVDSSHGHERTHLDGLLHLAELLALYLQTDLTFRDWDAHQHRAAGRLPLDRRAADPRRADRRGPAPRARAPGRQQRLSRRRGAAGQRLAPASRAWSSTSVASLTASLLRVPAVGGLDAHGLQGRAVGEVEPSPTWSRGRTGRPRPRPTPGAGGRRRCAPPGRPPSGRTATDPSRTRSSTPRAPEQQEPDGVGEAEHPGSRAGKPTASAEDSSAHATATA